MKTIFKKDSFVDYKGIKRPFTLCAIQDSCDEGSSISVGLSIVHASDMDKSDDKLGEKIAFGRAVKIGSDVFSAYGIPKVNNSRMANTILTALAEDVKYNPGKYIKGYDTMRTRYLNKQSTSVNE